MLLDKTKGTESRWARLTTKSLAEQVLVSFVRSLEAVLHLSQGRCLLPAGKAPSESSLSVPAPFLAVRDEAISQEAAIRILSVFLRNSWVFRTHPHCTGTTEDEQVICESECTVSLKEWLVFTVMGPYYLPVYLVKFIPSGRVLGGELPNTPSAKTKYPAKIVQPQPSS